MKEKVFKVVTVTPLMLGNADKAPELRPPAVRASCRYWLRATAGAVIGDMNTESLYSLESAVFGSTENGSPISVQIPYAVPGQERYKILPHKDASRGERPGWRFAFDPGESFEVVFSRRMASQEIWDSALAIFRLSILFGGLGLRSRRGYGTLRMENPPSDLEDMEKNLKKIVEDAVESVQALATHVGIPVLVAPPPGPCQYPCASQLSIIRIGDRSYGSAMEAVEYFMAHVPQAPYLGKGVGGRQASPLWVRPIQVGNIFRLLLVTLPSDFAASDQTALMAFLNSNHPGVDIPVGGWNA